jgi:hypothetical protein
MEVKGGRAGLVGRGLTRLDEAVSIRMCLYLCVMHVYLCAHSHTHTHTVSTHHVYRQICMYAHIDTCVYTLDTR